MKKIVTIFLTMALLLGCLTCLPSLGTAQAATGSGVNAKQYTYEIIPLLEPFNVYFFVKTENPDPYSFRFVDYDSPYLDDGEGAVIDLYESYSSDGLFADVVYENKETKRVKGGYIFWCGYTDTDGGKVTLQTPTYDYWGYIDTWQDTSVTVTMPKLCDDIDYLIDNYCQGNSFFDKMDAIQTGLSSICLYSSNYILGNLVRESSYWDMYRSPYVDQSYYIGSPYTREDNRSLFASSLYPLIRDSLGFPSTMARVALRLDGKATYQWSSFSHAYVDVTYNGETRTYGGQGNGKGQGISEDKISKYFTFGNDDMGISLESLRALHSEYMQIEMEDDVPKDDLLTWKDVNDTVGENGAWTCFTNGYAYLYKKDNNDSYTTSTVGSAGGSLYWGGSLGYLTNAWIDGRHISRFSMFDQGATFEEYPTDAIILTDTVYPVFTYRRYYVGYDPVEGYRYEYSDVTVEERTGLLQYSYNEEENDWRIFQYASYNEDGTYSNTDYATAADLVKQGLIDQKYADMLRLSYEQVVAMNVDRYTDLEPDRGYNYSGTVEAGTPFDRSAVNTGDLSALYADAKAIAEENGLKFSLDEGNYGMCGDDMYWVYLQDSQTLILTGTGEMATLGSPLWSYDGLPVLHLIVGEGIESLQDRAFYFCSTMVTASLPSTLKTIRPEAFFGCYNLTEIEIPASVETMGKNAFSWCNRMTDIYCLAKAKPKGWDDQWLGDCTATVHWGKAMPESCKHMSTKTDRKEASCTEAGYEDVICKDCGDTLLHTVLYATGHQYEDGICTVCGAKESSRTPGDINGNGEVEATDYMLLKRYCLGTFKLTEEQLAAADVNGDGEVNALDYMLVKRHVLGTYKIA